MSWLLGWLLGGESLDGFIKRVAIAYYLVVGAITIAVGTVVYHFIHKYW